mgnify:CR=1 FL=1
MHRILKAGFLAFILALRPLFHKQVLYSSKTLNKLSCHHLFVPTQPYPRFAYFHPKPGAAEPERFSRAGRKTHCIPFASAHLQSVRPGQISSAECAAMCQPSARSADKMTFDFLYPILHQLEEKSGVSAHFYPVWLPNVPLHAEKNQDFCGEKKCFLSRMKNFLLHKKWRMRRECAQSGVCFKVGNKNIILLTAI